MLNIGVKARYRMVYSALGQVVVNDLLYTVFCGVVMDGMRYNR
jgi:hypothetical protein